MSAPVQPLNELHALLDALQYCQEHGVTVLFQPEYVLMKLPGARTWHRAQNLADGVRALQARREESHE